MGPQAGQNSVFQVFCYGKYFFVHDFLITQNLIQLRFHEKEKIKNIHILEFLMS